MESRAEVAEMSDELLKDRGRISKKGGTVTLLETDDGGPAEDPDGQSPWREGLPALGGACPSDIREVFPVLMQCSLRATVPRWLNDIARDATSPVSVDVRSIPDTPRADGKTPCWRCRPRPRDFRWPLELLETFDARLVRPAEFRSALAKGAGATSMINTKEVWQNSRWSESGSMSWWNENMCC
jgi:hypothetical protein